MQPVSADNPWIASVTRGRPLLPAWAVVLLAAAVGVFAIVVGRGLGSKAAGAILTALANAPQPWPGVLAMAAFNLITFGPMAVIAVVACALDRRTAWLTEPRPLSAAAGGGAIGLGGFALSVALVALAGDVARGQADLVGVQAVLGVLAGVGLFAFQVAAEELYFRGWLQPILCARWGVVTGLIVTAVLFAALHLAGGARAPLSLLNLFLGGLLFGLLALRTGGLWAPFMAHFAWNWAEACGLGLEQNPGVGPNASLFHLALSGDALWSGGGDRLNASLAMSLVLASLVIGVAAFGAPRARQPAANRSAAVS